MMTSSTSVDAPAQNIPPDGESYKPPRFGCCLQVFAFAALALAALVLGAPAAFRYMIRKNMSASELARLDEFSSKPVAAPSDWLEPKPVSMQLITANQDLDQVFHRHGLSPASQLDTVHGRDVTRRLRAGEELSADELTSLTDIVTSTTPLLKQVMTLAALEGCSLNAAHANYHAHQQAAKLAGLKALLQARDGKCSEALELALLPLRLSCTEGPSILIGQLIALAMQNIGSESFAAVVEHCIDVEALRVVLIDLNSLVPELVITTGSLSIAGEQIAQLVTWKRDGYPIEIKPSQPAAHYYRQSYLVRTDATNFLYAHLPANDPRRSIYGPTGTVPGSGLENPLVVHLLLYFAPDVFYRLGQTDLEEARSRASVAAAKLGLLRLRLAQRITKLEGRPVPTSAAAYVPEYLPAEPLDPFSGAPFRWSAEHQRFYSVGPDGRDEKLSSEYKPSRGWSSGGDITLPALPAVASSSAVP